MAKKRTPQEEGEFLASGIGTEIDHWLALREHGSNDPHWSDGYNMNLTRQHIIDKQRQIKELCEENEIELPEEYSYAVPPEVDQGYMAPDLKYPERLEKIFPTSRGIEPVRTCPEYESYPAETGTPIDKIALSTRAILCAKRFGINTVEELAERINEFCKHAPNYGKQAREVLRMREINLRTISKKEKITAMIEPQMKTPPADVSTAVTNKYAEAYNLNVRICVNAQAAQQNLWEMCKGLKEMRDDKLFKELGYKTFEDYCEKEVGLSRFMAYKYAAIADMKNVESIQQIGVTKLSLLAKLDEPQREEIQQTVNVEEVSVRELKAEIEKLNAEKTGYKERQDKLLARNKQLVNELEKSEEARDKLDADLDEAIDAKKEALDTIKSLEHQLEELESKPRESYEDTTKIDTLKKQLAEAEERHRAELECVRTAPAEDVKSVFKAHMIAAVDALKHLTQYTEMHKNAPERNLFIEKLQDVDALINQTITILKGV